MPTSQSRNLCFILAIASCGLLASPKRSLAEEASRPGAGAASCSAVAGEAVQVSRDVAGVKVATDYGLATIAALARRVKPSQGRPPEGFYVSTFTYSIEARPVFEPAGCSVRPEIHVTFHLTKRMIELGRELEPKPCAWSAELQHYQRHARADESVVAQYASRVRQHLQTRPLPVGNLAGWVHSLIEDDVASLSAARRSAQDAVNTQDEMARLYGACSV